MIELKDSEIGRNVESGFFVGNNNTHSNESETAINGHLTIFFFSPDGRFLVTRENGWGATREIVTNHQKGKLYNYKSQNNERSE
mgnify:CR=1 FL=1